MEMENIKKMKTIKHLIIAGVTLSAVGVYADYTPVVTGPALESFNGSLSITHDTTFTVNISGSQPSQSDVLQLQAVVDGLSPAGLTVNYFTINGGAHETLAQAFNGALASSFTILVDWTASSYTTVGNPLLLDVNATYGNYQTGIGLTSHGLQSLTDNINVSAVPEPAQAIASVALLGCGGLIFIGRRFIGKKA